MRTPSLAAPVLAALALSAFSSPVALARADTPAASPAPFPALALPRTTSVRLENGLAVVLEEDHRAPLVSMVLRYGTGTGDEPVGREGIALVMQRMMVQATAHVGPGAYSRWLEQVGGTEAKEWVGVDTSSFAVTVPSNAVPLVAWLWSDQMGFFLPRVDASVLDAQRAALKNEWRRTVEGVPYGRVQEIVRSNLYPGGHPYHSSRTPASLDAIGVDDVKTFFDRHYAPSDAVLVLAGDIVPGEALALVRKYFGAIPSSVEAPRRAPEAVVQGEVRLEIAARVPQPAVVMSWATPALDAPGDADLDVASRLLSGQTVALLHWELVDRRRIATRVNAVQRSFALSSEFQIWASVAPGSSPEEVRAVIDETLGHLRSSPLPEAEVRRSVIGYLRPKVFDLEGPAHRAASYASFELQHDTPDYMDRYLSHYEHVTAASVSAAVARWLPVDRRVVAFVRPDPSAPLCGELRGQTSSVADDSGEER